MNTETNIVQMYDAEPIDMDEEQFQQICDMAEREIVRLENENINSPAAAALLTRYGEFVVAYRKYTGDIK